MGMKKAVIKLDVPDWQIGQNVTVYFPDTMIKHGKCELYKDPDEQLAMMRMIYGTDAQVVGEVVRCRDCIWYHEGQNGKRNKCNYHGGVTTEDKYCWWGEKDG